MSNFESTLPVCSGNGLGDQSSVITCHWCHYTSRRFHDLGGCREASLGSLSRLPPPAWLPCLASLPELNHFWAAFLVCNLSEFHILGTHKSQILVSKWYYLLSSRVFEIKVVETKIKNNVCFDFFCLNRLTAADRGRWLSGRTYILRQSQSDAASFKTTALHHQNLELKTDFVRHLQKFRFVLLIQNAWNSEYVVFFNPFVNENSNQQR